MYVPLLAVVALLALGCAAGEFNSSTVAPQQVWCIAQTNVTLCGSSRVAGAIDFLHLNGMQYINSYDHGRELQFAIVNQHGECFNPTEAGSSNDGAGQSTTSVLQGISTANNVYRTTSLPAFWLAPGQLDPSGCRAVNPTLVSDFRSSKALTIGAYGVWNAIQYLLSTYVPTSQTYIQFEVPTGYMPETFSQFFGLNLASGQLYPLTASTSPAEGADPVIISAPNQLHAMGAFLAKAPGQYVHYARFNFAAQGTSKWSVVWRSWANTPAGTELSFESIVCVGTLSQVRNCLLGVSAKIGYIHCNNC